MVHSQLYRILAWGGVAFQAGALVAVAIVERWSGVWSLALFLAVSTGFLAARPRLPDLLSFLVILAAVINAIGWAWDLFDRFVFYDEMVHAFTALAVSAAIGHLAWARGYIRLRPESAAFVLAVTALGLALGVLWEVAEALVLNLHLVDTLTDLLLDALGAAGGGVLAGRLIRRDLAGRRQ